MGRGFLSGGGDLPDRYPPGTVTPPPDRPPPPFGQRPPSFGHRPPLWTESPLPCRQTNTCENNLRKIRLRAVITQWYMFFIVNYFFVAELAMWRGLAIVSIIVIVIVSVVGFAW